MSLKQQGLDAEKQAAEYLKTQGLTLKQSNFSCKLGEIDLIMQDKATLVFVEVRQRKYSQYGGAAITVTQDKQRKLRNTAKFYLQQTQLTNKVACRFDVLAIDGEQEKVTWIKSAFY